MALSDQIATDIENVLLNTSDFGESSTYTPKSGAAATTPNVLVMRDSESYEMARTGNLERATARILVAQSDIAQPARGDSVEVSAPSGTGNETWYVDAWAAQRGGWLLACQKVAQEEFVGEGGRRHRG